MKIKLLYYPDTTTGGGDPKEGDKGNKPTPTYHNETSLDNTADIRDILSAFAAKGYAGIGKENAGANFQRLSVLVGKPTAIKLINNVDEFSQRSDVQGKSPQERVQLFYNLGSNDKDVDDILKKVKSFGYGVNQGLNTSVDVSNKKITGDLPENQAPQNYKATTPQEREQWNGFLDSVKGNKTVGMNDFNKYKAANPNFTITPDRINDINYEQHQIRNGNQFSTLNPAELNFMRQGMNPDYMNKPTNPNSNTIDPKLLYPIAQTKNANYGTSIEDYIKSINDPSIAAKFPITPK